ncbi:M50 family metallopeptidase [Heyndrickxia sporothermodurans]|uniref:M50 family metallopeptidase n=1 Tax=Heyndrickxia sporothermodurans TaxID=46224 RepID=UPI00192BB772|nr:M50 family metallopeptidase [Heyndrickxia sporothermodurans]MBL5830033.1 site-2 protease family protein [Heyndrickxia sporothermodurans]
MNNFIGLLRKIHIHPLFWIIVGIAVITARFHELLILFSILFIHEMGHSIMAHFFSWRIKKISILPFGGVTEMDEHGNRPLKEELLVILAGPIQHVWLAIVMFVLFKMHIISISFFQTFMDYNLMILLFNLLPIWPLDGGKLLHLLFSVNKPFLQAIRITLFISLLFLLIFHVISIIITPFNLNIWIVVIYLYISLWAEWKQMNFVFMRFLLERYYGKKMDFKRLRPLNINGEEFLYEVLEKFQRGKKHPLLIMKDGKEIGHLDENEVLHAYFAEKQIDAKVKDLMYSY